MRFIDALADRLHVSNQPQVLAGDFNQRIPARSVPADAAKALGGLLAGFDVPTSSAELSLIDHVALAGGLTGELTGVLPKSDSVGPLTDHVGAVVKVRL